MAESNRKLTVSPDLIAEMTKRIAGLHTLRQVYRKRGADGRPPLEALNSRAHSRSFVRSRLERCRAFRLDEFGKRPIIFLRRNGVLLEQRRKLAS